MVGDISALVREGRLIPPWEAGDGYRVMAMSSSGPRRTCSGSSRRARWRTRAGRLFVVKYYGVSSMTAFTTPEASVAGVWQ